MCAPAQIKNRDGTYIDANPIKDSVLVNVADLLQYWTNGVLKSTVSHDTCCHDGVEFMSFYFS